MENGDKHGPPATEIALAELALALGEEIRCALQRRAAFIMLAVAMVTFAAIVEVFG